MNSLPAPEETSAAGIEKPFRLPLAMVAVLVVAAITAAACGPNEEVVGTSETPDARASASTAPQTAAPVTPTTPPSPPPSTRPGPAETTTTLPFEELVLVVDQISADLFQPTMVALHPGDGRILVAERTGRIKTITDSEPTLFLDLTDRVWSKGVEQGLLGFAFHPEDASRLFVYYVRPNDGRRLSEIELAMGDTAPGPERILFDLPQPSGSIDTRHYGGMLQFGPDGYLWVSMGDGANASKQGQDPGTPFGAILRLDVDSADPYGIPADNPFVDGGGALEVWAFGLRNPWRTWIDHQTRILYIGDVGQTSEEEIDAISIDAPGANFGWPDIEGTRCFYKADCDPEDYHIPIATYGRGEGCSVTGGVVYRGDAIPELDGHYFYADWCTGMVRSLLFRDGEVSRNRDWTTELGPLGQVTAFGQDAEGEVLVATFGGRLFRIVRG